MVEHRCAQCGQVYDRDEQSDADVTVDDEDDRAEYVLHRACARAIFDEWYLPREGLGEYPDGLGYTSS